eukprot:TRINITY_DN5797_c0_g1_i1.p1 TRINITY_DN5797_c0_g1~~TRINITY_DN5797_c0_g1_i1.p1  ORF type:complete len:330 (+),score=40.60 TRINITY_DN5797_c0_g1_i1:679-1668(+)
MLCVGGTFHERYPSTRTKWCQCTTSTGGNSGMLVYEQHKMCVATRGVQESGGPLHGSRGCLPPSNLARPFASSPVHLLPRLSRASPTRKGPSMSTSPVPAVACVRGHDGYFFCALLTKVKNLLLSSLDIGSRHIRQSTKMDQLGLVRTTVNRGETLSRMINHLRDNHINPTHFLLLNFRYGPNLKEKHKQYKVRTEMKKKIHDRPFRVVLGEDDVIFIRWKCVNENSSSLYYATSRFDETYIRQLTRSLMQAVYKALLEDLQITDADLQLNYLTTKNMEFSINLATGEQQFIGDAFPHTPTINFETEEFVLMDAEAGEEGAGASATSSE